MCGAKYPPAPATTGRLNGGAIDSAHMALDSDCFSNATASTRRCRPACTRLVATRPVAPPTEPAVCTRSSGLPTAPSASARYSSGIITPSNRSGAFPTTTASMSVSAKPASSSARSAASRHSPAIDTSVRLDRCRVCPTPSTAASCFTCSLHDADQVLLQRGTAGGVPERASGPAGHDRLRRHPDPRQPGGEHRVAAQRAARGVDRHPVAEPQRLAQQDLLVGERRVQFGYLDAAIAAARPAARPLPPPGRARRRRHGQQVPRAQRPRVDPVREPGDPGRPRAQLPGPRRRRDDHHRGPVADRGAVVRPQRFGHVRAAPATRRPRPPRTPAPAGWPAPPPGCARPPPPCPSRSTARPRCRAAPAGPRPTPSPATAGRAGTGRAAGPARAAAPRPRTCRTRRPARSPPRR